MNLTDDLVKELKKDQSEGSYYYSWQANIAMAIKDEYERYRKKHKIKTVDELDMHHIANQGAKDFLNLLIK